MVAETGIIISKAVPVQANTINVIRDKEVIKSRVHLKQIQDYQTMRMLESMHYLNYGNPELMQGISK